MANLEGSARDLEKITKDLGPDSWYSKPSHS
jgi:hypothetical protein